MTWEGFMERRDLWPLKIRKKKGSVDILGRSGDAIFQNQEVKM